MNKSKDVKAIKNDKPEMDRGYALALVLGKDIEKNFRYELAMRMNDFDELNKYYQMGLKILKQENLNEKARTYEWIK